ncbi:MAG TPA: ATP-binding cassette domain-containing protein [Candidatus Cloacimonadota bacterium]|nr:ATP-binding cassette domain-containing protein [Candidatus Cloacimonadota bacterium]
MLIIENFYLRAGSDAILHVPNIHIPSGERALLCANNATGKTQLLRAIRYPQPEFNGSIQLREPEGSKHKNNTCILLELAPHLLKDETVWQNLVLPFKRINDVQERKLFHYLKFVGMEDMTDRKIRSCSFAQMKLVELVRSLLIEPYLLLLDDLDKFFDKDRYEMCLRLLEHINASGCSVFATSVQPLPGFNACFTVKDKELIPC